MEKQPTSEPEPESLHEKMERWKAKGVARNISESQDELLELAKSVGGMAKFQELVDEEMARIRGKNILDRGKAIKMVMDKLRESKKT